MGDANHEILKIPGLGCGHKKQLHAFIKRGQNRSDMRRLNGTLVCK